MAKEEHARVAQMARRHLRRPLVRGRNRRRGGLAFAPGQPETVEKVFIRFKGSPDRIQSAIELMIKARIYRIGNGCNQILDLLVAQALTHLRTRSRRYPAIIAPPVFYLRFLL